MFWKKKPKKIQQIDTRRLSQRLYAGRRTPLSKAPDLSRLSAEQLKVYDAIKYLQQFLNIRMRGHWCIEQLDSTTGIIGTEGINQPIYALCYTVWHGDCEVGSIEAHLNEFDWEDHKRLRVYANLAWADCFEAYQIRGFFLSIANIHEEIFDIDGGRIVDIEKIINLRMQDAIWDALAFQRGGAIDKIYREFQIGGISLSFEGDLGGYTRSIEYWKSQDINIFQLEKDKIKKSNQRDR